MEFLEKVSGHFKKDNEVICKFTCQKEADRSAWYIHIAPPPTREEDIAFIKKEASRPVFFSEKELVVTIPRGLEDGIPIKQVAHALAVCHVWTGIMLNDLEITEAVPIRDLTQLGCSFVPGTCRKMRSVSYMFLLNAIVGPIVQAAQRLAYLYERKDLFRNELDIHTQEMPISQIDQETRLLIRQLHQEILPKFPEYAEHVERQEVYQRYSDMLEGLDKRYSNQERTTVSQYELEKLPRLLSGFVKAFGQWTGIDTSAYEALCYDQYQNRNLYKEAQRPRSLA